MGITEGKIWYFCHSNRMMGWQSVNRVPSGVQLGQELTFGLIIWGSSPKGETHLLHTHVFNVWHQCTVRGMTDTLRGQPWEVPGPGDLKSSDLHGCPSARSTQEESQCRIPHDTCQVPKTYLVRGCIWRDPQGVVTWAGMSKSIYIACMWWVKVFGNHSLLCCKLFPIQTIKWVICGLACLISSIVLSTAMVQREKQQHLED